MKFSILIATYNADKTLESCLSSIMHQQGVEFEILIADGLSSDNTVNILEKHDSNIGHWHSKADKGIYDAWNSLISRASGDWIIFLGADDRLDSDSTLGKVRDEIIKMGLSKTALAYVYGKVDLDEAGETIEQFGNVEFPNEPNRLNLEWPFSHTGLLHNSSLFERFGSFTTEYKIAGDYHFVTQTLQHPETKTFKIDVPVAIMGAGGMSTSATQRYLACKEVQTIRRTFELTPQTPKWLNGLLFRSRVVLYLDAFLGPKALLFVTNIYRYLSGRNRRQVYR